MTTQFTPSTFDALDAKAIHELFGPESGHVPVQLSRLTRARVIWVNESWALTDPEYQRTGGGVCYAEHLLKQCAFQITPAAGVTDAEGYADRYGGAGIGTNGGAGRAAYVNGYYVKGVGRTPLVSSLTDSAHASGGAYLEECIRETIFSEIVSAEFPHGGIPCLAIIDTGLTQRWDTPSGPKWERRTLLVRPAFLRPAHFERALGFRSARPFEGALDRQRVERTVSWAKNRWGNDFAPPLLAFWVTRWAEQMAYGYAHRLSHASTTSSNVTLSGALVDFGAATSLDNWASTTLMLGRKVFGREFYAIQTITHGLARGLAHHGVLDAQAAATRALNLGWRAYQDCIAKEMLKVFGFEPKRGSLLVECSDSRTEALAAVDAFLEFFQQERNEQITKVYSCSRLWDSELPWASPQSRHLRPLHRLLSRHVAASERPAFEERAALLARTRSELRREQVKDTIQAQINSAAINGEDDDVAIAEFVSALVARNRRETKKLEQVA